MELNTFESVKKTVITNSSGVKYTQFKASLKPKYHIVWINIFFGYAMLFAILFAGAYLQKNHPLFFGLTIPVGAILIGYWFAFTHLFIHEASHFNIAPDKKLNDLLADIFLGFIAGTHIKFYRIIHFDHHRYLGTSKDTENTYFEPLNWKFILESITGIRVIKVITNRNKQVKTNETLDPAILKTNTRMFITGTLFNVLLTLTFVAVGLWQVGLMWIAGIGVMFPFFLSLRQLLEHRAEYARANIDYFKTDHGEVNRMFGTGLIASTLGSAGFNRHLLHHWDPHVSCTRLKEMEQFLRDTELRDEMEQKHTNYFKTFIKLFNK
jgi:fatty acid desaturase